jgi:glycyl-tRNA synthetase alpha subunit
MAKYQQGDVLFVSAEEDQWRIIEENLPAHNPNQRTRFVMKPTSKNEYGRTFKETARVNSDWDNKENVLTVAYGEVTGHSHAFNMVDHPPGIAITAFGKRTTRVGNIPEFIKITGDSAVIKHEEHNALSIPAGHYKVSIVKEWDHISGTARYVVD